MGAWGRVGNREEDREGRKGSGAKAGRIKKGLEDKNRGVRDWSLFCVITSLLLNYPAVHLEKHRKLSVMKLYRLIGSNIKADLYNFTLKTWAPQIWNVD